MHYVSQFYSMIFSPVTSCYEVKIVRVPTSILFPATLAMGVVYHNEMMIQTISSISCDVHLLRTTPLYCNVISEKRLIQSIIELFIKVMS